MQKWSSLLISNQGRYKLHYHRHTINQGNGCFTNHDLRPE